MDEAVVKAVERAEEVTNEEAEVRGMVQRKQGLVLFRGKVLCAKRHTTKMRDRPTTP